MKYKIAFHSYKGGVGRTKIMVGLGVLLAMEGVRVGMLDFDLDSSGLATIFGHDNTGVGENELLHILKHVNPSVLPDAVIDVTEQVEERTGKSANRRGCLKYIPTISNPEMSDQIRFSSPMRFAVLEILEALLQDAGIDLLLIDLKPGFSPSSALIFPLVDKAIIVTRLDQQNMQGLGVTVPIIRARGLDPYLVVNMVPNLLKGDDRATQRIKELEMISGGPVNIRIGYDPNDVFEDDIGSCVREGSQIHNGLKTLSKLVKDLVEG